MLKFQESSGEKKIYLVLLRKIINQNIHRVPKVNLKKYVKIMGKI